LRIVSHAGDVRDPDKAAREHSGPMLRTDNISASDAAIRPVGTNVAAPHLGAGAPVVIRENLKPIIGKPLRTTAVAPVVEDDAIEPESVAEIDLKVIAVLHSGVRMRESRPVSVGQKSGRKSRPGGSGGDHRPAERQIGRRILGDPRIAPEQKEDERQAH
jgi:hypothetical protein